MRNAVAGAEIPRPPAANFCTSISSWLQRTPPSLAGGRTAELPACGRPRAAAAPIQEPTEQLRGQHALTLSAAGKEIAPIRPRIRKLVVTIRCSAMMEAITKAEI